ncbi:MAG: hypothetical protein KKG60_03760 [Nanoarchaeota archaeon]|nr:hypothetical protein [Nanoarchaeota archaeon]
MAQITITIPEELKQDLNLISKEGWSSLARNLLKKEIERLSFLKSAVSNSKFTEKDVNELSDKVNESLSKRFKSSVAG